MPDYGKYPDFAEGLAQVEVETDEPGSGGLGKRKKVGFVDTAGRVVIAPQFDRAYDFSEGLAAVQLNYLYGYIDRSGRVVIRPRYGLALDFSEGLAVVEVRGTGYGYIDAKGRVVIGPGFDGAWSLPTASPV